MVDWDDDKRFAEFIEKENWKEKHKDVFKKDKNEGEKDERKKDVENH